MTSVRFQKLIYILRKEGIVRAAKETAGHIRTTVEDAIAASPGHYKLRYALLTRRFESEDITPRWVSPSDISYLTGEYNTLDRGHLDYSPFFRPKNAGSPLMSYEEEVSYGATVSGDWDQHREPFSKLLMYRGIRQHYLEGILWPETVYYERLVDRFCHQGMRDSTANTLAMNRCEHIEAIYQDIKTNGYQSQRELNGHPLHEVTVNVARDGTLLYNSEGRHRLSIAKILDIEKIPVLVLAQHAEHAEHVPD